ITSKKRIHIQSFLRYASTDPHRTHRTHSVCRHQYASHVGLADDAVRTMRISGRSCMNKVKSVACDAYDAGLWTRASKMLYSPVKIVNFAYKPCLGGYLTVNSTVKKKIIREIHAFIHFKLLKSFKQVLNITIYIGIKINYFAAQSIISNDFKCEYN
ncbi:hypothetical protein SFRURICE_013186, partial [Spodoptera frugiperda]